MSRAVHRPAVYRAIKSALKALINEAGGAEPLARLTGSRTGERLRNYADQTREDDFAPADVIADVEAEAARPLITEALARANGWLVIAGPERAPGRGCAYAALRAAGEFIAELSADLARGGEVDRAEAPRVIKEGLEAQAAISALLLELGERFPDLTPALPIPEPGRDVGSDFRRDRVTEKGFAGGFAAPPATSPRRPKSVPSPAPARPPMDSEAAGRGRGTGRGGGS